MNDFMDFLGYLYVTGQLDEDETQEEQDDEFDEEADFEVEAEEI